MTEKQNTHGGRRPGSGRKRQPAEHRKVAVNVRISRVAADWLRKLSTDGGESKAAIIERLVLGCEAQKAATSGYEKNDAEFPAGTVIDEVV